MILSPWSKFLTSLIMSLMRLKTEWKDILMLILAAMRRNYKNLQLPVLQQLMLPFPIQFPTKIRYLSKASSTLCSMKSKMFLSRARHSHSYSFCFNFQGEHLTWNFKMSYQVCIRIYIYISFIISTIWRCDSLLDFRLKCFAFWFDPNKHQKIKTLLPID